MSNNINPKDRRMDIRVTPEFIDEVNDFIKKNNLNKSKFIREAIRKAMQHHEDNATCPFTDNAFYNYVLKESVTNKSHQKLLNDFNRRM